MAEKLIRVDDYKPAGEKLVNDVGDLNVVVYDVPTFQNKFSFKNYPAGYLDKCVSVSVAISGSQEDGINWALIAPYRVDASGSNNEKVYDIDPMIIALDNGNGMCGGIGYIGYHQDFPGRTTWEPGYSGMALSDAVTELRSQVTSSSIPLSAAPEPIKNALTYMAERLKTEGLPSPLKRSLCRRLINWISNLGCWSWWKRR